MKKYILLLVGLGVLVVGYYGVSQKVLPRFKKPSEVSLLVDPILKTTIIKLIVAFEKQNPDIKVKMTLGSSDTDLRHSLLTQVLSSKSEIIDVFWGDVIWSSEFISNGWLLPITKDISQGEQDRYLKAPLESCRGIDSELYCLPIFSDAGLLYYRKDILEKNNILPPTTWDELVTSSKKIMADNPGMAGIVFQGSQYEGLVTGFLEYVWGNNGDITTNGKFTVDSPSNQEALQFMVDLIYKYKIAPESVVSFKEEESRKSFQDGNALYLRNWPYVLSRLRGTALENKVGIIPMVHGIGGVSASTLGGASVMVSRFSEAPRESVLLAKFLASDEAEKILALDEGVLPSVKALYQDKDIVAKNPDVTNLYEVLLHTKPRPVVKGYREASSIMQKYIHQALTRELSAKDALSKMQQDLDVFQNRSQ